MSHLPPGVVSKAHARVCSMTHGMVCLLPVGVLCCDTGKLQQATFAQFQFPAFYLLLQLFVLFFQFCAWLTGCVGFEFPRGGSCLAPPAPICPVVESTVRFDLRPGRDTVMGKASDV